jgi:AraC-like DNA-binding protein
MCDMKHQKKNESPELLSNEDHSGCYLSSNQENPQINYISKIKNEILVANNAYPQMVFLLKGKITYSYGNIMNRVFEESTFVLFPAGYNTIIKIEEDSTLLFVSICNQINLCYNFTLELLYKLSKSKLHNVNCALKINGIIADYIDLLVHTIDDGLKCPYFQEIKQKELLFYLRTYYSKEDLFVFFAPILYNDISFSELMYQTLGKAKNIQDLAAVTDYSLSGFKKHFVKVFGMHPYQWLMKEKAKRIYHEINCTNKSLNTISTDFQFSSPPHFNRFCKKVFGMPPGAIRKNSHFE